MDCDTCSWKGSIIKYTFLSYFIQRRGNDDCRQSILLSLLKSLVEMPVRRTPKVEALVVNAIRRLQDVQGSTSREISNYISQEYDLPRKEIRRQVQLALQRGLAYGILHKSSSGYYSCNRDYLGQLSLGDGTGDGVMEPCPWRRRRFGRRGRRRSGSRSRRRRRQRRGKVRARQRRDTSRRRRRRRRGRRRRRRRRDGRRSRRRSGERTRTRADPDEIENEAMVSESKENNASKDDAQRKSETSISEHSGEMRLQDSPRDSESLNTPGDI